MVENLITKPICLVAPTYVLGGKSVKETKEKYHLPYAHRMLANENPLGISPKAAEAIAKAAVEGGSVYPDTNSTELRTKLAGMLDFAAYGMGIENLNVTAGAEHALNMIMEIFLKEGDEVLISAPSYSGYNRTIARAGGVKKTIPFLADGHCDFDGLLAAITDQTKIVILCNPNNPTGCFEKKEKVQEFVKRFPKDKILIVDEAYIHFAPGGMEQSVYTEVCEDVNLIVTHTFSKIYGMAGIRVGYIISNREISGYLRNYGGVRLSNVQQAAALAALDDQEFYDRTLAVTVEGRDYLIRELRALGYSPYESAANFVFCDLHMDKAYLDEAFMRRGILIRTNLEYPRISVGTMEQNQVFIEALKEIREEKNKDAVHREGA